MQLTRLKLWNFRRFGSDTQFELSSPNLDLQFANGLNVLIGENDSGKTAIIDAIRIVLGTHSFESNRVSFEDFFHNADHLRIELHFTGMSQEVAKNFIEWLCWTKNGEKLVTSLRVICDVRKNNERVLPYEVRAGADEDGTHLSAEAREYLRCTYLRPLRDAGAELIPKRNSRLSRILLGHSAFKGRDVDHCLLEVFTKFNSEICGYFDGLDAHGATLADSNGKDLKEKIDEFIRAFHSDSSKGQIGVADGNLKDILERLSLTIEGVRHPGLGTLNRLFMAAELVHLSSPDWHGLKLGLVEELEAHLHPQAQMKVIEKLQARDDIQLILTSHSPNLVSKVKLESLIVCDGNSAFPMGETFTELDNDDYGFLERFLDVTKSNLFFANGVILVEGWSEEVLIPALAKKMKACGLLKQDLTEAGITVVNVGNTAYLRYARIFRRKSGPSMRTPVAVITDIDVPEYEKEDKEYVPLDDSEVQKTRTDKLSEKLKDIDHRPVKSFIAPRWTLEYSLHKSRCFGSLFSKKFLEVHTGANEANVEYELGKKLLNRGLEKLEIAYRVAASIEKSIDDDAIRSCKVDDSGYYLMDAILYACKHQN